MYYSWLDRWDERRAQRGEEDKTVAEFALDAHLAFANARDVTEIDEFGVLSDQALLDPTYFDVPTDLDGAFQFDDASGSLRFPSSVSTEIEQNNTVSAKITPGGSRKHALVVFHQWNAKSRKSQLAKVFSRRGISVVEISMPYHFERSRPGSTYADYMLSPNLGLTLQAVRQAVLDGRALIAWLRREEYNEISVLGMSLGSWVAALVAAHDTAVVKASLLLSAGCLADMVWTGRATRQIRQSLETEIDLPALKRAWGPVNIENYAQRLARPNLDLQLILAKRDKVVLPDLSQRFISSLKDAEVTPDLLELNCGHYSLSMPPHILFAGLRINRFLSRS